MTTLQVSTTEPAQTLSRRERLAGLFHRYFLGNVRRKAGGFVSSGIIATVLVAMVITLFGTGAVGPKLNLYDGAIWLWNRDRGEADRVNASAGQVDLRRPLTDTQGHRVKVIQDDRHLLLQDLDSGTVTSVDLKTLNVSGTLAASAAGARIGLFGGSLLAVDATEGLITQRDATSFKPIGSPIKLPKNLIGGVFDGKGRFWLGSPETGKVISIRPGNKGPKIERQISVHHEKHPWAMGALDDGVAVVDSSSFELIAVNGHGAVSKTAIPSISTATMPDRIRGDVIPITDPVNRKVIVVRGDGISGGSLAKHTVRALSIAGTGNKLGTATAFSERLYLSDEDAGLVRVVDLEGKSLEDFNTGGGPVEMESRENHLMINSQDTDRAWVVDARHQITGLRKNSEGEAAGIPSSAGPTTAAMTPSPSHPGTKPPNSPSKTGPTIGPKPPVKRPPAPDAPVIARVLGNSDGSVTVEWYAPNAHGGTLQSYDVHATTNASGGDRTFSGISHVNGSSLQRMQIEPRALVQGASYTFTVVARSTNGAVSGPSSPSGITRTQP
ncbi:MAG TPA: fibronectin type III domain-containing protein [Mycobacteriales bacterium]|jgi:hypothetical protein|nr:fibronectin type III domain-containing protein [Mycobacteriales bacterium]